MNNLLFVGLSFACSCILIPIIIFLCKKFNCYDFTDTRKIHSGNIPRLGGIGIAVSFFASVILFLYFSQELFNVKYFALLISGLIIFVISLLDDFFTLSAKVKLIFQLIATTILVLNGFIFDQICGLHFVKPFAIIFTFVWVIAVVNAFNLIDGLDGLCGSLSFTALVALGFLYYFSNNMECYICFILASSILGFLCFNWPPAKIFMGDCGSTFLGFMIATIPLYTVQDDFEYNKFLMALVINIIPIMDVIAAIWRRLRDKKPIMSPDKSHLHHKLLNIGFTKKQALFSIMMVQILLCSISVLSYFLRWRKATLLLLVAVAFVSILFSAIHFINRKVNSLKS